MKKILLFITFISIFVFSSCFTTNDSNYDTKPDIAGMKTVVIDSCEYIQFRTYGAKEIAHKGNCKYCAERQKKITEEAIKEYFKNK